MKKQIVLFLVSAALAAPGCGGSGQGEFEQALRHQCRVMAEFTAAVEEASGSEEVIAALARFRKEAKEGRERMLKLAAKYPELVDRDPGRLPEKVRAELERIEEVSPRFISALIRIEKEYGRNPEVRRLLDDTGLGYTAPRD